MNTRVIQLEAMGHELTEVGTGAIKARIEDDELIGEVTDVHFLADGRLIVRLTEEQAIVLALDTPTLLHHACVIANRYLNDEDRRRVLAGQTWIDRLLAGNSTASPCL